MKKTGGSTAAYRELLFDSHVWSCVQSLKAGVTAMLWDVVTEDDARKEVITDALTALDIEGLIAALADAVLFGYQPAEILWEERGGLWLPRAVIAKPPEWFAFGEENELRLCLKTGGTEELPPMKFIVAQSHASYANPYGEAALARCWWWIVFKKAGARFWATMAEHFGMPFAIGKHPVGETDPNIEKLTELLETLVTTRSGVIPENASLEIVGAKDSAGSTALYKELLVFCNGEISKAIIGQTLTTEVGERGTYAAASVHAMVRKDIIMAAAGAITRAIQPLIDWITELNFGDDAPRFRMFEREDVDMKLAERDERLIRSGVRLTPEYFKRAYNLTDDDIDTSPPTARASAAQFAESTSDAQSSVDGMLAAVPDTTIDAIADAMLAPVRAMIGAASSYEELQSGLVALYPDIPADRLDALVARATTIARIAGNTSAPEAA
jgi:phage gp29-like protein